MTAQVLDFGVKGFRPASERVKDERAGRLEDGSRIIPYGVSYIDDYTAGLLPNDMVVIGARTGAGKTSLATGIAKRAAREGRRVHFFALEAEPNEIERRLKYRLICQMVYSDSRQGMASPWLGDLDYLNWRIGRLDQHLDAYEKRAEQEMQRYRSLVTYYRGSEFRVEDVRKLFLAIQDQSDLIILDHLHYVDFDDDRSENAAIRRIVLTIRDTALDIGVPVIVIAHLRKTKGGRMELVPSLDDFHGTSEITKRATSVIVLAPADDETTPNGQASTYIHVGKHRARGACRFVARQRFHLGAREYTSRYELGRLSLMGDEWNPIEPNEWPRWAQNATAMGGL